MYASLVDGFCRVCLVLKEQIEKHTDAINEKYIYQNEGEANFNERAIYKQAFDRKIIGKELYEELNTLYDIRNKVIHRFFIGEVEYSHLEIVCNRYELVYKELWDITYDLEAKQIDENVGMTIKGSKITETDKAEIHQDIVRKIKSFSERNLAKTLNCTSVEEIIEFASKKELLIECVCGHAKIMHVDFKILDKNKFFNFDDGLTKCLTTGCGCSCYKSSGREKV
ncbi:hypothetical protein JW977_00950 [Candidatus Falkowbacteria bacterium]|nr:hypothetical protein [Candidatus Falkowbacteria bacterium]